MSGSSVTGMAWRRNAKFPILGRRGGRGSPNSLIPRGGLGHLGIQFAQKFGYTVRGARSMIETYPLENAAEAYARMMSGKAEFLALRPF